MALADDIIVQHLEDFLRRGHALLGLHEGGLVLLPDDLHAEFDAFVADEHGRARDQFPDLVLALAAERAVERVLGLAAAGLAHLDRSFHRGLFSPFAAWGDFMSVLDRVSFAALHNKRGRSTRLPNM